jgi:hypothetical protein
MQLNQQPAIIKKHSPLRKIPQSFSLRERAFFDGIVYSIEIADMSYRRLRQTLWSISQHKNEDDDVGEYVHAVADAWLFIDSLNRLRALCKTVPMLAEKPYCRGIVQKLHKVKQLRNNVQHLDGRIDKIVSKKQPVWGALSWAVIHESPPLKAELHTLIAGTFRQGEHELPEIGGRKFAMPVDVITLNADGESLDLSDLILAITEFSALAESDLEQIIPPDVPYGRDLHIIAEVSFNDSLVPAGKVSIAIS